MENGRMNSIHIIRVCADDIPIQSTSKQGIDKFLECLPRFQQASFKKN